MAKGYKTGGRQKGTPNKNNPTKGILINHSSNYFTPREQVDIDGKPRTIQRIKWVVLTVCHVVASWILMWWMRTESH